MWYVQLSVFVNLSLCGIFYLYNPLPIILLWHFFTEFFLNYFGDDKSNGREKYSVIFFPQGDGDFTADGEVDDDVEDTIEEQENVEKKDYSNELQDLRNEGELKVDLGEGWVGGGVQLST